MHVKTYGRLTVRAVRALRDVERAERWLKSPTRLLDGRSPLEALKTAEGIAKVEKQLKWFVGKPPLPADHRPRRDRPRS
ncbi:MAG: MbcA/ParS/Xre antitoxin family protein [Kiloniellales bacterium]|nr:MbcA/ParS/Xre antitoxin family protein [Kiloniellales bacterium]